MLLIGQANQTILFLLENLIFKLCMAVLTLLIADYCHFVNFLLCNITCNHLDKQLKHVQYKAQFNVFYSPAVGKTLNL